jgi:hypothetical protein
MAFGLSLKIFFSSLEVDEVEVPGVFLIIFSA